MAEAAAGDVFGAEEGDELAGDDLPTQTMLSSLAGLHGQVKPSNRHLGKAFTDFWTSDIMAWSLVFTGF